MLFNSVVFHSETTVFVVTVSKISCPLSVVTLTSDDFWIDSSLDAVSLFVIHGYSSKRIVQFRVDFTLVEYMGVIVGEGNRCECSA